MGPSLECCTPRTYNYVVAQVGSSPLSPELSPAPRLPVTSSQRTCEGTQLSGGRGPWAIPEMRRVPSGRLGPKGGREARRRYKDPVGEGRVKQARGFRGHRGGHAPHAGGAGVHAGGRPDVPKDKSTRMGTHTHARTHARTHSYKPRGKRRNLLCLPARSHWHCELLLPCGSTSAG